MASDDFSDLFEILNNIGADQFGSLISSCQYLKAYGLAKAYFPKSSRVLDWGAGNGHFSVFLASQGFNTTSFNLEGESLSHSYLMRNFSNNYCSFWDPNAVAKLPFGDNSFEGVASIGVLEHVREHGGSEMDSLNEINRILIPGGYFLCYHFPNKFSWIEFVSGFIPGKHRHIHKYERGDILDFAKKSGMHIVVMSRYGFMPRLMFGSVPDNKFLAEIYNLLDTLLERIFSIFCQNYYFVLKKSIK